MIKRNVVLLALAGMAILIGLACVIGADNPPSPVQSTLPATVRDFGAVGDGKADDTVALQKAVDAGIGEVRLPRGIYRITSSVVIDLDRVGWTSIVGSASARIVMAGPGPALKFIGTHTGTADPNTVKPNVWERQRMPSVDGVEIVGAHEKACGIEATGTMKLTLTRVLIREALHGIHLTGRNRNLIVSNCHLYKNRGVGLYLDNVNLHQINVTGCHISYNGAGGVVVRGGSVFNLQISGCDIEGNMAPDGPPSANVLVDGSGAPGNLGEIAITGCTIQHTTGSPGSANIRFVGAGRKRPPWGNLVIADNVINDVQINIDIRKVCSVTILGNNFQTGVQHNLRIEDSQDIVVGPNVFDRSPVYGDRQYANNGLLFRNCKDLTLTGLHINGVRRVRAGLILENCHRANVTNCTILDCDNLGLLLSNVTDSRVSDCLIRNDLPGAKSQPPLKVTGGRGNMIVDNQ